MTDERQAEGKEKEGKKKKKTDTRKSMTTPASSGLILEWGKSYKIENFAVYDIMNFWEGPSK